MSNTLCLYVNEVDSSFIQNEIQYANKTLDLYIISNKQLNLKDDACFTLNITNRNKLSVFIKNFFSITTLLLKDSFSKGTSFAYLRQFRYRLSTLLQSFIRTQKIKDLIQKGDIPSNAKFVSFFFDESALVLALLVKQKVIPTYYSRTHGRDTFEWREPKTKKLAFTAFKLKYVKKILPACEEGSSYLRKKFSNYREKIKTNYLGTLDLGIGAFDENSIFTIVSCGTVRNIKRFHLIPQVLQNINFPIRWIHFGGINEKDPTSKIFKESVSQLKLKENIEVILKGPLKNDEILQFYKKNSMNLFFSPSETEGGAPVSIQEAISFGIPAIATDAGGTKEIVNETTGILIPINFDTKEVASQIVHFSTSDKNTLSYRKEVRACWEERFKQDTCYKNFMNEIFTLDNKH